MAEVGLNFYFDLKALAKGSNQICISTKELCKKTGLSSSQVKLRLKNLLSAGYIEIKRNTDKKGRDLPNEILLLADSVVPEKSATPQDIQTIVDVFHRLAEQRHGQMIEKKLLYKIHAGEFKRIVELCEALGLDLKVYVSACFHTFNKRWCLKTFNKPYPLPYVLTNKRNAVERYESYLRYQMSMKFDTYSGNEFEHQVLSSLHKWKNMGEPDNIKTLLMLADFDILCYPFVYAITGKEPEPNLLKQTKEAKQIIKQQEKKNG